MLFVGFDHAGDAEEFVAFGEGEEFHAFAAAVDLADGVHRTAHALALGREEHDFVGVLDAEGAGDVDGTVFGEVDRPDAAAAAVDEAVVLEAGAHAEAGLAGYEELRRVIDDFEDFKIIAVQLEAHAGDARRGTTRVAEEDFAVFVFFPEADGEALVGDEDEFVVARGDDTADEVVTLGEVDADEAGLAGGVGVVGEGGLFDDALLGRHDEVAVAGELLEAEHGGDLFAFVESEE